MSQKLLEELTQEMWTYSSVYYKQSQSDEDPVHKMG